MRRLFFYLTPARLAWFGVLALLAVQQGVAQENDTLGDGKHVSPKLFGFEIPAGKVRPGSGQRVLTRTADGREVVARVHCIVGSNAIVMLPDGELIARRPDQAKATKRPFVPDSKDDIAGRMTEFEFEGFKTKQTNRYLYVYNASETFATATSRIMETMFPGVMAYAKAQGIDVAEPDVPLVVIMFRTEKEFREFSDAPRGMLAYYNSLTNHVVMYESGGLGELRPDLGVQQAFSTIAHEGAHQILHNIGVQQRLSVWPMWLSEGMAEFFAPTSADARLNWKGAGQVNDMRMFELEQYLKARPADADGRLIEDTVQAARLTSTGYAAAWSLTHYLAKNERQAFHRYVKEVSQLGPLQGDMRVEDPGRIPTNKTAFEKHFGDDYKLSEQRLIAHLNRQPYADPFANSPHYVAMMTVPLGRRFERRANVFRSQALCLKWRDDNLAEMTDDHRNRSEFAVRVFPNKSAAMRFMAAWKR